jgi:GTP cyclohydrolase FolE2
MSPRLSRLRRTLSARRYAATPEDAEDACQRGLEILLTKAPSTSEEELIPWLKTVVIRTFDLAGRRSIPLSMTLSCGDSDFRRLLRSRYTATAACPESSPLINSAKASRATPPVAHPQRRSAR